MHLAYRTPLDQEIQSTQIDQNETNYDTDLPYPTITSSEASARANLHQVAAFSISSNYCFLGRNSDEQENSSTTTPLVNSMQPIVINVYNYVSVYIFGAFSELIW